MAESAAQSYHRHAHRPVLTAWAALFAILAFAFLVVEAFRRPGLLTLGLLSLVFAVMVLVAISRVYIVRLQDRIIRLETRVRLARLGRESDYGRLTTPQMVALRFASDSELPALLDRTLAENLGGRQIKQAIRDWQADDHRT